jgi:hypothetical protein
VRYKTIGKPFLVGYSAKMNMASGSRILIDLLGERVIQTKFLRPEDETHTSKMRKSSIKRNICVPTVVTDQLSMGMFIVT